jgi:hypothetical protein
MRLVAFGCSNTFGGALPDVWGKETRKDITSNQSKYAWPQLLANKLNIECVNNGIPGASNKEIWYRILKFKFHKNDIVVVNWSLFDRWCIIDIEGEKIITRFHHSQRNNPDDVFFKYIHNFNDIILDFYLRVNHIQTVLQDKIKLIKYYCSSNPSMSPNWNKIKFSNISILDIKSKYPLALDNHHPGPEAHKAFATEIYNEIKDENTEKLN